MALNLRHLFSRRFSTCKALRESLAEPLQGDHGSTHEDKSKLWKMIFIVVCIPAIGLGSLNCLLSDPVERPEFKKWPYMRIRNKPFPWGDGNKTLFHNPHMNALPDGYEEDHH